MLYTTDSRASGLESKAVAWSIRFALSVKLSILLSPLLLKSFYDVLSSSSTVTYNRSHRYFWRHILPFSKPGPRNHSSRFVLSMCLLTHHALLSMTNPLKSCTPARWLLYTRRRRPIRKVLLWIKKPKTPWQAPMDGSTWQKPLSSKDSKKKASVWGSNSRTKSISLIIEMVIHLMISMLGLLDWISCIVHMYCYCYCYVTVPRWTQAKAWSLFEDIMEEYWLQIIMPLDIRPPAFIARTIFRHIPHTRKFLLIDTNYLFGASPCHCACSRSLRVSPLSILSLKTLRRVFLVLESISATGIFERSRTMVGVGFSNNSANCACS